MGQRENSQGPVVESTTGDVHSLPENGMASGPHFARPREHAKPISNTPATAPVYYPWFDWLRGFLAVVVMLSHLDVLPGEQVGSLAVQVFFALSGWLIGGMLLRMQRADVVRFYFNRAFRIWVPYYLGLLLLVSVSLLRDQATWKWFEFVTYKLTFVYNLFGPQQLAQYRSEMPLQATGHHFWSVNAEEQFYLVAPLLLVLLPGRVGRHVVTWAVLAIATWWLHTYFVGIVFGVLAAVVVDRLGEVPKQVSARVVLALAALVSLSGVLVGYDLLYLSPIGATALVLLLAIEGKAGPIGTVVGGMSYPLYLNHWATTFLANGLMKRFLPNQTVLATFVAAALSIAMAVALYWFVDRRLRFYRQRWYTPRRGRMVMWVSYAMVSLGISLHYLAFPPLAVVPK